MSASAPSLPGNSGDDSRRPGGLWFALSLLIHGGILAVLIFLIPVAEIARHDETSASTKTEDNAVSASPEMVKEVSEQIQATQTDEVRASVEELQKTDQSMAELKAQTEKEFAKVAENLAAEAPQKAQDALAKAAQAQAAAVQAQQEAIKAAEAVDQASAQATTATTPEEKNTLEADAGEALKQASEAQSRAREAQGDASQAQADAAQQLSFQTGGDEVKAAQAKAAEAQAEANNKQDVASQVRDTQAGLQRNKDRTTTVAARTRQDAERAQTRVSTMEQSRAKLEEIARQQQAEIDQAKAMPEDQNAQRRAAQSQRNLEATDKRLNNNKADLERAQKLLADTTAKATAAATEAETAARAVEQAPSQIKTAQEEALKAQQAAQTSQTEAQQTLAKAASAAPQNAQAAAAPVPSASPTTEPSLDNKNFAELYNTAVETEKAVAAKFQAVRAAQVAVQKQIPLSEAQKYVQVAVPVRTALPPEATATNVTDPKALEAQKEAISKARQELESMVSLTRGMAYQALGTASSSPDQGVTITAEAMQAEAAQQQQFADAATEMEGQTSADLSGLMKQAEAGKAAAKGETGTHSSQTHGPENSGAGGGSEGGTGDRASLNQALESPQPPSFPKAGAAMESVAGRKVQAGDYEVGAKWMYVDTWWVIGPFPNPDRRNIETRFPPESVVDLGASYPTDTGEVVKWHFVQNTEPRVRPPLERSYAIYYAYTELWFDAERDLWFATGSDDFSKIWINDLLVWASGKQHKSWRPNEGYRKVHFKKGLNRILLRVENGQFMCAFSFMLCMQANPQ